MNHSNKDCTYGWGSDGYTPGGSRGRPERRRRLRAGHLSRSRSTHLEPEPVRSRRQRRRSPAPTRSTVPCYVCGKQLGQRAAHRSEPLGDAFDCRSNLYVARRERLPRQVPQPAAACEPEVPQATAVRGARQPAPRPRRARRHRREQGRGGEARLCAAHLRRDAAPRDSQLQALRRGAAAPLPDAAGDATDLHGWPEEAGAHAAGQPPGPEGPGARGRQGAEEARARDRAAARAFGVDLELRRGGRSGRHSHGLRRAAAGSREGRSSWSSTSRRTARPSSGTGR